MIEASFDSGRSRAMAVSGAYQYDTGQRLRMHGLPSPEEFSGRDDHLSGAQTATVQVHFSHVGDSQAEMRLAIWDIERRNWVAEIPDEYLTRSEEVHVYVYVYHGETENEMRARTMYEGVFTPISRPAPSSIATPEQEEEWEEMLVEIDLALVSAETAAGNAVSQTDAANTAAQSASGTVAGVLAAADAVQEALDALEAEGGEWMRATFTVTDLAPGSSATVKLTEKDNAAHFEFGIPRGADGADGAQGEKGPADVTFVLDGTTLYVTTN